MHCNLRALGAWGDEHHDMNETMLDKTSAIGNATKFEAGPEGVAQGVSRGATISALHDGDCSMTNAKSKVSQSRRLLSYWLC